ncbi:MAG: SusD/RagB family nutrient-binding outer membrane lipoprotein [Ginsengibacter sp.]
MRKKLSKYISLALLIMCMGYITSCKKDFGTINTNPSLVTTPDVKFLFSYSEDKLATYKGTEWVWESMEQLWRFTQHITSDPYELSTNVNSRYNAFYSSIVPNLFEIRRQISTKPDKDSYQKMAAVTYILQVLQGIKVSDMNGSIPYSEADQGRYKGNYSPVYDTQQSLFDTWLKELTDAIAVLESNSSTQQSYGASDIYYGSDWTKWVMLANTLKLRIAARVENQDQTKTQSIFQEVMKDAIGPISEDDTQLSYSSVDFLPFGTSGDIDYRSPRYASASIIKFLKASDDPRLPIYFEKNDLQGSFKDTLNKYSVVLPSFININDPLIMYQGGPADWTLAPTYAAFIKTPFQVGPFTKYFLISHINRRFFSPRYNGNTSGQFTDVMVTNAESCLLVAEFIQKGYAGGVDTKGTASDWYNKGVTSSIKTMNNIAIAANSTTGFSGDGTTEISTYLNSPEIKLDGANDLERIYIQEYLNLYRNPPEAFVFCRRTGYPKLSSTYYAREAFNEVIPRRWWTTDPGEVNRSHWSSALQEEGFTPLAQDVQTLNSERVWYDKKAPDFGKGN